MSAVMKSGSLMCCRSILAIKIKSFGLGSQGAFRGRLDLNFQGRRTSQVRGVGEDCPRGMDMQTLEKGAS